MSLALAFSPICVFDDMRVMSIDVANSCLRLTEPEREVSDFAVDRPLGFDRALLDCSILRLASEPERELADLTADRPLDADRALLARDCNSLDSSYLRPDRALEAASGSCSIRLLMGRDFSVSCFAVLLEFSF